MNERGWRKERVLQTTDTLGRPVVVTTGLTTDARGDEVVGLAVSFGGAAFEDVPTAVLTLEFGAHLVADLRESLADLLERRGGV